MKTAAFRMRVEVRLRLTLTSEKHVEKVSESSSARQGAMNSGVNGQRRLIKRQAFLRVLPLVRHESER